MLLSLFPNITMPEAVRASLMAAALVIAIDVNCAHEIATWHRHDANGQPASA